MPNPKGVNGHRMSLHDRFWTKVSRLGDGDCWEWQAHRNSHGYGKFRIGSKCDSAHRVAWRLANSREIPDGIFVCHRCDNPPCVNPAHLFLGTPLDNVADSQAKDRRARLCGETNPSAKISDDQAKEILHLRRGGRTLKSLAEEYGVSITPIWLISTGKRAVE